jgi:hypothetical protein
MGQKSLFVEINIKHKIQCGQNVELFNIKLMVHHVTNRL